VQRTASVVAVLVSALASAQPAPLRLDEAIAFALVHQPQVLQAQALTGISEARFEQSRGAVLPQVIGTASIQRVRNQTAADSFTQLSFGVSASQTLWDFTAIERLRAANRFADAQRMLERATRLTVVLNVRRAFIDARAQQQLVKVAEESLANQLRHQTQIEGFVKAEIRPEIDLAQSRTDVANARVSWVNAHNGYRLALARLHQAIGVGAAEAGDIAADDLPPVAGEGAAIEALVSEAVSNRPELASLALQRQSQDLTINAARGGYIPTLSAAGAVAAVGSDPGALGLNWNVGIFLNWQIFQGGTTAGLVHEAERNADSLIAQEQVQQLQVRLDVESARLSLEAGQALIEASNDAVTNARARLKLAEGRYEAGVGSAIELGDAQIAVTNAGAQLVQAQFNLSTARAQLLAALGRAP
jgi:outer membrane protein